MERLDQCIINACTSSWDQSYLPGTPNKNNCSGFFQSVAAALGVPLPEGNADSIMGGLAQSQAWQKLASGMEAAQKASQGYLVVVGIKGSEHKNRYPPVPDGAPGKAARAYRARAAIAGSRQ